MAELPFTLMHPKPAEDPDDLPAEPDKPQEQGEAVADLIELDTYVKSKNNRKSA